MSLGVQSEDLPPQLLAKRRAWLQAHLDYDILSADFTLDKLGLQSSKALQGVAERSGEGIMPPAKQKPLPLQVSRKLQMAQTATRAEHSVSSHSGDVNRSAADSWSRVSNTGPGNSLARELFLHRFNGSPVNTVFAPGEYHIPE